jgi:hypothetical protein
MVSDPSLPPVAIDFEVFYDKEVSIKTLGSYKYLRHPKQDALRPGHGLFLVAIYDGEQLFVGRPEDFDWPSIFGRVWLSHNRSFDMLVYKRLVELGLVEDIGLDDHTWHCTADLATYLKCKRALKDAARILLGVEMSKDVRTLMKGLYLEDTKNWVMAENGKLYPLAKVPGAKFTLYDHLMTYGGDDAKLCWQLWVEHGHKMPERERRLSRMTTDQAHRGLYLDQELMHEDLAILREAKTRALAYLPWVNAGEEDPEGVLSLPALRAAIEALGVKPPTTTSEDSQELRKWELAHPDILFTKMMRQYRKCNTLMRRYEHMLSRMTDEGRYIFSWLYGGAHTLRWSGGSSDKKGGTGETGNNVQNFPKEPLYFDEHFELCEREQASYECDLRKCITAPPGKKLVIFDAAQIEPRILKWLVVRIFPGTKEAISAQDELDRIAAGESIYEVHARKTMGWTGGNIKKENPKKQFVAKQRVLGLGYGCGSGKYRDKCLEYHVETTMAEAKAEVADFRAKERGIVKLWAKCDNEFKASIGENYELELPDGSVMTYFNVHRAMRTRKRASKLRPGTEVEQKRMEIAAQTEQGGRVKFFYGGLLVENWVQRIAREVMAEMLLACDDHGWTGLFTVHDEGVLEVDESVTAEEVQQAVAVKPWWADGLPIEAEAKSSPHYLKD